MTDLKKRLTKIEKTWKKQNFEEAVKLADLAVDDFVTQSNDDKSTLKDFIGMFQAIYNYSKNHQRAAQFIIIGYPHLKQGVQEETIPTGTLYGAMRELTEHIHAIGRDHPNSEEYISFFEKEFKLLMNRVYQFEDINDCIADACFAGDNGYLEKALHIIDVGLEKVEKGKGQDVLIEIRSEIKKIMKSPGPTVH
ncbi:MAG TPA: hypothetical protein QF468_10645 [Nitrospinota bacterium]|nr:hypothetical protein [Nitrospinota bacterium]|tara:strand:+ start:664 stop:1245 length:582 start_codon:yes stop_codon:yes gene_type:complete